MRPSAGFTVACFRPVGESCCGALKVRYPGTFRVPLMGVRRRFQRSRLGSALAFHVIEAARPPIKRHGVRQIELSWILEDNAGMRNIIESIGGSAYKRYRVYERNLDAR